MEGASRESSQNLELLFNVNEHVTSCVRMDVIQYEEGLKSIIALFARVIQVCPVFFGPPGSVASLKWKMS